MILGGLRRPIVLAPMAGGPSTPGLAVAVSRAGGLGFLAGAYLGADALEAQVRAVRDAGVRDLGVNLFVPGVRRAQAGALEAYAARMATEGRRHGATPGRPTEDGDDDWDAKLDVLERERVSVASFTFGLPDAEVVRRMHGAGAEVWVTVNRPDEAEDAARGGADALVVQGVAAGGHQGGWTGGEDAPGGGELLTLLAAVRERVSLPLVAAGGIMDAAGVAAVLAAGARAAQPGTAFLLAPEAGTHPVYREALRAGGPTDLTLAFTGRWARGLRNRFMDEHGPHAPAAFPAVHRLTAPLRAAARDAGDAGGMSLWAGTGVDRIVERPAADTVAALAGPG